MTYTFRVTPMLAAAVVVGLRPVADTCQQRQT
jgi:hypothetical protein